MGAVNALLYLMCPDREPHAWASRPPARYPSGVGAFDPYLTALRGARAREAVRSVGRVAGAREAAANVAEALAMRLGVQEVTLFGSLARGSFNERSDIDLAVRGLAPRDLVEAHLLAAPHARGYDVSIVPVERAAAHIRDAVEREGVRLWPR